MPRVNSSALVSPERFRDSNTGFELNPCTLGRDKIIEEHARELGGDVVGIKLRPGYVEPVRKATEINFATFTEYLEAFG